MTAAARAFRSRVWLALAAEAWQRLERVEAVGKNLLLGFEGGLVVRSHLRMTGRWPKPGPTRSSCRTWGWRD